MGKVAYRVTNWKTYNESLVRRGSLTMWVDQDLIENWNHPPKEPVRRGCPRKYHPDILLLSLVIRYRFGLPYRQTEGFLASLLQLMGSDLQVPDYSYLCKQAAKLGLEFEKMSSVKEIAIDSSGLKVAGEGEWKVRGHGTSKRRVWKKIHISVDVTSKEILAVEMTDSNVHDSEVFEKLLPTHCEVIYADGAYDQNRIHEQASRIGAKAVIPPRKNAALGPPPADGEEETPRDALILMQDILEEKWSKTLNYGRRAHSEGVFSRFKRIFGGQLQSRKSQQQFKEIMTKISILNRFTGMGLSIAIPVA